MPKAKSPYDDDVNKAIEEGRDLPEGTILNFYTTNKHEERTVEDIIAHATQNNPGESSSKSSSRGAKEPATSG